MIRKLKSLFQSFDEWDRGLKVSFGRMIAFVDTFNHLVIVLLIFGSGWGLFWYAHIIFPWLEHLLGLGPYDIDSIGKIRWRRMYSTAICAPPMLYVIVRYAYNQWKKRR